MKTFNIRQIFFGSILNCLKLDKNLILNSLLVVLIGVFLLPNEALTSPITDERIIELSNKERVRAGITSLVQNERLNQAAESKAEDLLKAQIFEHNIGEKKFSAWIRETDYNYSYVGENLAIDFITSEGIIKAWISSDDHKRNLLSPNYREIGVAVLEGNFQGQNTVLVVQIFGTQLKPLVPDEILKREERLKQGGTVLSANENFLGNKILKEKNYLEKTFSFLDEKKSIMAIEILVYISSCLFALFFTYLYLLALISLIKFVFFKRLK